MPVLTPLPTAVGTAPPNPNTGGFLSGLFGGINDIVDGVTDTAENIVEGASSIYNAGFGSQAPRQAGPVVPAASDDSHILGIEEKYIYIGIGLLVLLIVVQQSRR